MAVQTPSPPPAAGPAQASCSFASWGERFAASLVDWIFICSVVLVIALPIAFAVGDPNVATVVAFPAVPLVFVYFAHYNGRGQTLGKHLLQIRVVDEDTGQPIGFRRALAREWGPAGSWIPFVGWLFVIVDRRRLLPNERHQSRRDSAAHSIVIRSGRL